MKNLKLLLFSIFIFSLSSCYTVVYAPRAEPEQNENQEEYYDDVESDYDSYQFDAMVNIYNVGFHTRSHFGFYNDYFYRDPWHSFHYNGPYYDHYYSNYRHYNRWNYYPNYGYYSQYNPYNYPYGNYCDWNNNYYGYNGYYNYGGFYSRYNYGYGGSGNGTHKPGTLISRQDGKRDRNRTGTVNKKRTADHIFQTSGTMVSAPQNMPITGVSGSSSATTTEKPNKIIKDSRTLKRKNELTSTNSSNSYKVPQKLPGQRNDDRTFSDKKTNTENNIKKPNTRSKSQSSRSVSSNNKSYKPKQSNSKSYRAPSRSTSSKKSSSRSKSYSPPKRSSHSSSSSIRRSSGSSSKRSSSSNVRRSRSSSKSSSSSSVRRSRSSSSSSRSSSKSSSSKSSGSSSKRSRK